VFIRTAKHVWEAAGLDKGKAFILFPKSFVPPVLSTQLVSSRIPVAVTPEVMRPQRVADHWSPSCAGARMLHSLPHDFMTWCLIQHSDTFTFTCKRHPVEIKSHWSPLFAEVFWRERFPVLPVWSKELTTKGDLCNAHADWLLSISRCNKRRLSIITSASAKGNKHPNRSHNTLQNVCGNCT
jgi:hypothetical protein